MIPLSLLLVVASLGLLAAGLLSDGQALVWGSLVASLAAGGCLLVAVRSRRGKPAVTGGLPAGGTLAVPVDLGGPVATPPPASPPVAVPAWGVPASPVSRPAAPPPRVEEVPAPTPRMVEDVPVASAPSVDDEPAAAPSVDDEPGVEDIPVPDALRVAQLADPVLVVDGHPRYHLADCPRLADRQPVSLPVWAARRAGFTPCAVCRPDAALLGRSRSPSGRTG